MSIMVILLRWDQFHIRKGGLAFYNKVKKAKKKFFIKKKKESCFWKEVKENLPWDVLLLEEALKEEKLKPEEVGYDKDVLKKINERFYWKKLKCNRYYELRATYPSSKYELRATNPTKLSKFSTINQTKHL